MIEMQKFVEKEKRIRQENEYIENISPDPNCGSCAGSGSYVYHYDPDGYSVHYEDCNCHSSVTRFKRESYLNSIINILDKQKDILSKLSYFRKVYSLSHKYKSCNLLSLRSKEKKLEEKNDTLKYKTFGFGSLLKKGTIRKQDNQLNNLRSKISSAEDIEEQLQQEIQSIVKKISSITSAYQSYQIANTHLLRNNYREAASNINQAIGLHSKPVLPGYMPFLMRGRIYLQLALHQQQRTNRIENLRLAIESFENSSSFGIRAAAQELLRARLELCNMQQHPLSFAAQNGYEDVVIRLLKNGGGCNKNHQDTSKKTALHHAAENKHIKIYARLILARADVRLEDSSDKKAWDYLSRGEDREVEYWRRRFSHAHQLVRGKAHNIASRVFPFTGEEFFEDDGVTSVTSEEHNQERRRIRLIFQNNYLQNLLRCEELRPILAIVNLAVQGKHDGPPGTNSAHRNLSIVVDPETVTTEYLDSIEGQDALGSYYRNIIKMGAKVTNDRDHEAIRGTFTHECTHFVAAEVMKNYCCPYKVGDTRSKELFDRIVTNLEKRISDSDAVDPILRGALNYNPLHRHGELIVRAAQLIGHKGDEGRKILREQVPELLRYFTTKFIPACKKHHQVLLQKAVKEFAEQLPGHSSYSKQKRKKSSTRKKSSVFQYGDMLFGKKKGKKMKGGRTKTSPTRLKTGFGNF